MGGWLGWGAALGMVLVLMSSLAAGEPRVTGSATDRERSALPPAAPEATIGAHGLRLPASFSGDLPCADCERIRYHLNLWPDQVFHLRRRWLGEELARDEIGRWYADAERGAIALEGGGEAPLRFEVKAPDRLRLLDLAGNPIESDLPYELAGGPGIAPLEPRLRMRGMLTYLADAARITECLTGRDYPVAFEADWPALEAAYGARRSAPGAGLMASFEGVIAERPRMEGAGTEATVIVERHIEVLPGASCERTRSEAQLIHSYWKIRRLRATEVVAAGGRREPHLILRDAELRFAATVGCNQMSGSYALLGDALRFGAAVATRMACLPPLDAQERQLGEVLAATARWRIQGHSLELFDPDGASIALFEAVYLR